jgi:hypothetical protein
VTSGTEQRAGSDVALATFPALCRVE